MHLDEDDKLLIRRGIIALENQCKREAEDLRFEEEVLVHMTGAERTAKVHSDVLKSEETLSRLARLRSLFSAHDIDITLSKQDP